LGYAKLVYPHESEALMTEEWLRPEEMEPEEAYELLADGVGRRDFLRVASIMSAGAIAPAWALSAGADNVFAGPNEVDPDLEVGFDDAPGRPGPRILQPGQGQRPGHYVESTPDTVRWGYLPNRDAGPVLTVNSGSVVTFDTVSHEGILEDQGRDPDRYFGHHGVSRSRVLRDARAIANSDIAHDFDVAGPHVVTGPVHVRGAVPGDVLKVKVLRLVPRAPYGVVSNRHGKGALAGEYPRTDPPHPDRSPERPELYNNVSIFVPARRIRRKIRGVMPITRRHQIEFAIDPFMGLMGVALDTSEPVHSVPPTEAGGNLDIRHLRTGATLYLPVFVPGAKFFVGDPHFRQGHGEVALTAWEAPLRGTFRLTLLKKGSRQIPGNRETLAMPFGEDADYWMPVGINADLDEAMKQAVREAIAFLHGEFALPDEVAYAYMSAATDYVVSQVVDRNKGVHALIAKDHFRHR
jgi:acetamidase/formamidase